MSPAPEDPKAQERPTAEDTRGRLGRRAVLKHGTAAAAAGAGSLAGLLPPSGARAQSAVEPGDQVPVPDHVLRHEYGFALDIPGAPGASQNIREIAIEPFAVEDSPGRVRPGEVTPVFAAGPASQDVQMWFQDTTRGKCIRKDISITILRKDRTPGRTYSLIQCFPVAYSAGNFDTSSTVQTETLTLKVERVEFKT